MAWSAPLTAVANATLTSAQWNASVRDNLNATENGIAADSGSYFVTTAANAIATRKPAQSFYWPAESYTSGTYGALKHGTSVGLNTGTEALCMWSAGIGNDTAAALSIVSASVSGATTVAASDAWCIQVDGVDAATATDNMQCFGMFHYFTGLTPGINQFTMQFRVGSGTGWFQNRCITVIPF